MSTTPHSQRFDPGAPSDIPDGDVFAGLDALSRADENQRSSSSTLASMLSGARSLTPILEAVVFTPGLRAPDEDLQHAVETMLDASRTITDRAMHTLGIEDVEPNEWAKSMLMQLAVGGVTEQWKAYGHADPSTWLAIIDNVVDAGVTERQRAYPDIADHTAYQVSHFAALSEIASEVRRFPFFYDATALLERFSRFMDEQVTKAADHVLEGVAASHSDRLMVEQGLLKHASRLFAEIYREEAEKTYIEVSRMSADERQQYIQAKRPAEAISNIRLSFESIYSILTETSRERAQQCVQRRNGQSPGLS